MAGHERLIQMSDEDFHDSALLLEKAFVELAASFFFNGDAGSGVDVFDFFDGVEDVEDWVELRSFASDIQPMLFLALEGAPESVIRAWANDHVPESGDVGVSRVEFLRENLESVRSAWGARFGNLARTIGDIRTTHVFDENVGEYKTVIHIDSFFAEGLRKSPAASSREHLTAALTRNELRRVIDVLKMADFRYDPILFDDDDIEDSNAAPETETDSPESEDSDD